MIKTGVFVAALFFVACATNEQRSQPAVVDTLYFGTAMHGGKVSENDWERFLAQVITPRFPKGVTSWIAAGQWQNHDGSLSRERSYALLVVHDDSPESDKRIGEIISTYKKRFRQEAVLRVRNSARISF